MQIQMLGPDFFPPIHFTKKVPISNSYLQNMMFPSKEDSMMYNVKRSKLTHTVCVALQLVVNMNHSVPKNSP